jgi:hypothetical protein
MGNEIFSYLYQLVTFYVGIKVKDKNSVLLNSGVSLSKVWSMQQAITQIEHQRQYAYSRLLQEYGARFRNITGRDLLPEDLRVSFCPQDEKLKAVYLDDVDLSTPAHILVETSLGNYQAHFGLNRPCDEHEAKAVIRALRDWYGGDAGAAKARQARRFVTSYVEIHPEEELIDVDEAVHLYVEDEITILQVGAETTLDDAEQRLFREIWGRKLKTSAGDKSRADFGLAVYLLKNGYTPEVAMAAIRCARPTLVEDKQGSPEKYLLHTISKAAQT